MEEDFSKCDCEMCQGDKPVDHVMHDEIPPIATPASFIAVDASIYPNTDKPIVVLDDEYEGAHLYFAPMSLGIIDGQNVFTEQAHAIRFVHKYSDAFGNVIAEPGVTDAELVTILLDRLVKLNNKFPSEQYDKMKQGLELYLEGNRERIDDRLARGVAGQFKK